MLRNFHSFNSPHSGLRLIGFAWIRLLELLHIKQETRERKSDIKLRSEIFRLWSFKALLIKLLNAKRWQIFIFQTTSVSVAEVMGLPSSTKCRLEVSVAYFLRVFPKWVRQVNTDSAQLHSLFFMLHSLRVWISGHFFKSVHKIYVTEYEVRFFRAHSCWEVSDSLCEMKAGWDKRCS